jgi:Anti-sigma-K factor rskA/Putative zinc-finger
VNETLGTPDIEALIGAYALDAVEPDERAAVEAHLATCPRCRAELADHLEVASMLAYTGAPAPDGLWTRIASALEEPPPAMRLQVVGSPTPATNKRRSRALVGLAAAAVLLIVVLGVQVLHQGGQIDRLNTAAHQSALGRAADQALLEPTSQKLKLTSPSGDKASAIAVLTDSGTGYLMPANLPALPKGRTYQLWGITPTQVVSLGLLGPDPHLNAFPAHGQITGLAVTDEVAGGVTQSTHAPVIVARPT